MEKVSKKAKKKTNPVLGFIKDYVSDFGFRQLATLIMLIATVVLAIGVFATQNETTIIVGFALYAAAAAIGLIGCVMIMTKSHRRSPTFKRALFNLIVLFVLLAMALTGIIVVSINGIFA